MDNKDKAEIIAARVWKWLKNKKQIDFVPWVLNPESSKYDPEKALISKTTHALLDELETSIIEWSEEL